MKKLLLFSLLAISSLSYAQTNSVELKDGTGGLLSQHNSVAAAYAAIPATVTQPYIIEVTGTYTGANETAPVTFSGKTGTSIVNTVTLRPAAGVGQVVMSGNLNGKILVLDNVNYHIIDGRAGGVGTGDHLKIQNLSTTTSSYTIELINGACFNTLEYLHLYQAGSGTAGPRVVHLATSASNIAGNSNNTIQFCKIQGSRSGIYSGGTLANKNTNNLIYGCEIYDWSFAGVWLQSNNGSITIDSCSIYETVASVTNPTAIHAQSFDAGTFTRNKIYGLKHSTTVAIKGIAVSSASTSFVSNNMVSIMDANSSCTNIAGIEFSGSAAQNATVLNNTIRIGGALSSGGTSGSVASAGFSKTNTSTSSSYAAYNNIVVNERTGGNSGVQHVASAVPSVTGTIVADNNTYNATSGLLARFSTFTFNTIPSYQSAVTPQEANTNSVAVQFASSTDLHLTGTSLGNLGLGGLPQGTVTVDIDNEPRGAVPYRGADESVSFPLPVELLYFNAAKKEQDVLLLWNIAGGDLRNVELERSFDGVHFTSISSVTVSNDPKEYAYTDANVLNSKSATFFYRLKMNEPTGYHYSHTVLLKNTPSAFMSFSVYPNPATSLATAAVQSSTEGEIYMELTDYTGRVVSKGSHVMYIGTNSFQLDMSSLPTGIYMLRIRIADEWMQTKLQKL